MNAHLENTNVMISVPGQGKELSFAPQLTKEAEVLLRAERQGFYYPVMAMKHLRSLSTGLSGKNNVFIPNINDYKSKSFQKVVVFVPGIRVTVETRGHGKLVVTELYLDPNESYMEIEKGSRQKPGVYQVERIGQDIKLEYKSNGRITPKDERKVVVADTRSIEPEKAAEETVARLEQMFGHNSARKCDFDMFFSPVGSKLGGMLNYNPSIISEAHAFAALLADAMEQSSNKKGIEWVSDRSGCVVLTQGLQILASKNVTFREAKHTLGMYKPTTNPGPTVEAAKRLGMLVDNNISKGSLIGSLSCFATNLNRAKDKNDAYSWKNYADDLANGTASAAGVTGAMTLGAAALVSSPVLGAVGTFTGAVGAMHLVYKYYKNR